jgi:hypothetical protein
MGDLHRLENQQALICSIHVFSISRAVAGCVATADVNAIL